LWPIKWLVELVLVAFHNLFTFLGLESGDGLTWVLAIVGLVLLVRTALIPLFVRQIKSQRGMVLLQPELQKLQKKYKGKTDQDSRKAFAEEQMALYKKTGSNPLSSCLPLLAQMPIFMGLFFVLSAAAVVTLPGSRAIRFSSVVATSAWVFAASLCIRSPHRDGY